MNKGRLLIAGLIALAFAVGASSTAHAGSYGFSISTGPAFGPPVYPVAPAIVVPPPPPVVYSYPVIAPAPVPVYAPPPVGSSFSFSYVSR